MFELVRDGNLDRWLVQFKDEAEDIKKALEAICRNPTNLGSRLYEVENLNEKIQRLQIYYPVYRLRIRRSRFRIVYRVDLRAQTVRVERMARASWVELVTHFNPR